MKNNLLYIFSVSLIAALFSVAVFAQENRRTITAASSIYVVSAEAGGVNYVEGKVAVARKQGKSGLLLKGDELDTGDKVSTGADGRAEILLNPGSFVRVAENSNFEFLTTSLDNLQLKLNGGSAMLEIITDREFTVAVNTPKAKFYIVKSGVYRVDVLADGSGKIEVWRGEAQTGETNATRIKSGKQVTVNGNEVAVVKFDRDGKDALEAWSKTRAKELAKINERLSASRVDRNRLRDSLMNSFYGNGWNLYGSYGVWVFNPFYGSYCFLPFGYGWNSPYGYYYPRDIGHYNLPPVVYNQPTNNPTTNNPTTNTPRDITGGVRGNNSGTRSPSKSDQPTKVTPPYKRVEDDIRIAPSRPVDIAPFPSRMPDPVPVFVPSAPTKKGGN